jgi:hypothetical protein
MGVAAVSAPARRPVHGARGVAHPRAGARRYAPRPYTGRGRQVPTLAAAPPTFWERMHDDQDLIRFKVVLLTTLALLTAILEWVA